MYFLNEYNDKRDCGTLTSAGFTAGRLTTPVEVTGEVMYYRLGSGNNGVYCFKEMKNGSGELFFAGKSVAADVYAPSLFNYKSADTQVFLTNYSEKSGRGTLRIAKGNSLTRIAEDVSFFAALNDNCVAYLADFDRESETGDLFLWKSGKSVKIDSGVTALLFDPDPSR